MKTPCALIIADSAVARQRLTNRVENSGDYRVVGAAPVSNLALRKVETLKPDVVVLQAELPREATQPLTRQLRERLPGLPVVMRVSDVQPDPVNLDFESAPELARETTSTAKSFRREKSAKHLPQKTVSGGPIDVVAIGTSTGGPAALAEVLKALPADFPVPILIVQHMPAHFTRQFAGRLSKKCNIDIHEASEGDVLTPSTGWLAPGEYHMVVRRDGASVAVALNQEPPENSSRPAVDVLFRSIARTYGSHVLATVMTGMGADGTAGCEAIRDAGGHIIAQDEDTSIVWGMPGAVVGAELAHEILPLDLLGPTIVRRVLQSRLNDVETSQHLAIEKTLP